MEAMRTMDNRSIEELDQFRHLMYSFDYATLNTGVSEYVHRVLKSELFRELYFDRLTELIDEGLAGPFLSIAANGHCDYLFREHRLENVQDADSFLGYCLNLGREYREAVQSETAHDSVEKADLAILLEQAELLEKLSYLAHTILKEHDAKTREAKNI
jgi:hypothetical protein